MREKEGGKGERNIERERSENGGRREKREMVVRRRYMEGERKDE